MGRLRRFPDNRYIGIRTDWFVYDCDDEDQFAELEMRVEEARLLERGLLAAIAPDTLAEARNRGFTPVA